MTDDKNDDLSQFELKLNKRRRRGREGGREGRRNTVAGILRLLGYTTRSQLTFSCTFLSAFLPAASSRSTHTHTHTHANTLRATRCIGYSSHAHVQTRSAMSLLNGDRLSLNDSHSAFGGAIQHKPPHTAAFKSPSLSLSHIHTQTQTQTQTRQKGERKKKKKH